MNAEDLLFLLYTSGTTAKPKGIKHTTGGYLTHVTMTHKLVFDLKEDDRRLLVHGRHRLGDRTLVHRLRTARNGATSVIYEGTPDFPDKDRFWEIVERYQRDDSLHRADRDSHVHEVGHRVSCASHDLSSLRLLGTVGEPINPEAWMWYRESHRRRTERPVVDTWWQTETGGIMITPLPGITTLLPGSATQPLPGISADIVNERGEPFRSAAAGTSCSRARGRGCCAASGATTSATCRPTGRSFPHRYFAGDGCNRDADGNYWFMGRIDDVMNVSGHRISTTEVESALVDHPKVAEAAVVRQARRHDRAGDLRVRLAQGRAIRARRSSPTSCATTSPRSSASSRGRSTSRSRKNCRRRAAARSCAACCAISPKGRTLGDTTTLADSSIVAELAERAKTEVTQED